MCPHKILSKGIFLHVQVPIETAKANGVVRQQETVLTFEGASPSLDPSQPF